jgi:hypothetical protein
MRSARYVLSDTQWKALELVELARREDAAVEVAGKTRRRSDAPTIRRATAIQLVQLGYLRWSSPAGRFALITPGGRSLLAAKEAA